MAAAVALSAPAAAAPPAAPAAPYAAPAAPLAALMPEEADLPFEEEILRDPYSVKAWLRYLDARLDAPLQRRAVLYERALRALPGSYKLWNAYLLERLVAARGLRPDDAAHEALAACFERALVTMHKVGHLGRGEGERR